MHTPGAAGRPLGVIRRRRGMVMIGAAPGGAWSTASAEGRSRRLRKATVEGLSVVCAPGGGGVVEVLAPGVGAVVRSERPLI